RTAACSSSCRTRTPTNGSEARVDRASLHGDRPDLEAPAAIAREVGAEWGVALEAPSPLACYSFVAAAGADAVLKLRTPEDDESDEEADALALWAGDGA